MKPFTSLRGIAIPFGMKNVDTDLILPGRYLKTITRDGLGKVAFSALREDPDNLFDSPRHRGAPILIAGDNFGCGSSREHAPWALQDMGISVVIAPSFADIFASNAFKNGMVLVALPPIQVDHLLSAAGKGEIFVDLERQIVETDDGDRFSFDIDGFRKNCLLKGLDEIGLTLSMTGLISAYEQRLSQWASKPRRMI